MRKYTHLFSNKRFFFFFWVGTVFGKGDIGLILCREFQHTKDVGWGRIYAILLKEESIYSPLGRGSRVGISFSRSNSPSICLPPPILNHEEESCHNLHCKNLLIHHIYGTWILIYYLEFLLCELINRPQHIGFIFITNFIWDIFFRCEINCFIYMRDYHYFLKSHIF